MEFRPIQGFSDSLSNEGMKELYRAWREHAASGLPRRPDFDPTCFTRLLPHLQLHERKPDGRYFCRVSGTAVVEAYGFESTNKYIGDVIAASQMRSRVAILDYALERRKAVHYWARLVIPGSEWRGCERLVLPLADPQGKPRFILSLLDFTREPPADALPPDPDDPSQGISVIYVDGA